jgi:hypothetical protein
VDRGGPDRTGRGGSAEPPGGRTRRSDVARTKRGNRLVAGVSDLGSESRERNTS